MSTRSIRRLALGAAIALALTCLSCDKGPTRPLPVQSSGFGTIVRLDLVAPAEIAPGESVQLDASAVRSDGSVVSVRGQGEWTVQSAPGDSVLTVTGTGLATGREPGRSLVTFRFADLTADATVLVLPRGTFRLAGTITSRGVALDSVTVAVDSGIGEGLIARTNAAGEFELYGIAGSVQIRASKAGYIDRVQSLVATAHTSTTIELQWASDEWWN
jgi:hypothetical protein